MIVKRVQDQEGRKYAIPDHILEDFEVSGSIPLPRKLRGSGSKATGQPGSGGRLKAAAALGGYDDPDPGEEVSNPDPGELEGTLNRFLNTVVVTATFAELAAAVGLATLRTKAPTASAPKAGRLAPSLQRGGGWGGGIGGWGNIGGYIDEYDGTIEDVGEVLAFLTNPAISQLKVTVSAAAVRQLLAGLTS